ncbi:hypothetical protein GCM10009116_03800 [Brevundimonas basaltis]|uniref:Glycosyltransferase involved in cell wall biosynthesis n=1 Tax=Brevundimonas basaltis TaxID=472166 RepID=A0A7W8MH68_9CAUL|nr:glycosyltransferase family 4 protein [Brevundimonas basaltis]MBB5292650.1 glycosyltransferase involved in cell wall biosynthesis [Brevundimonas basaltis]
MIIFAHLLNDRSGSPRVLKSVIEDLGFDEQKRLYIGSDGDGILAAVEVDTRKFWYRRTPNRLLTMLTFCASQVHLLWSLLCSPGIPRDAVVYVNTLLPFGAGLFGRLTNRPVIYHIHEMSLSPPALQRFLVAIARYTATRLIYVSDAHRTLLPIAPEKAVTVYNSIDVALAEPSRDHVYRHRTGGVFTVLMLSYARSYKGISELLSLARHFSNRKDIRFNLVVSDGGSLEQVEPSNLTLLPPTDNPEHQYAQASLVLNLSRPDLCVETFGLTLLEAMAFGIPVIAPPVGGPAELVTDGKEGLLIDSRNGAALAAAVGQLADDEARCLEMSAAARARAAQFGREDFRRGILSVIEAVRG